MSRRLSLIVALLLFVAVVPFTSVSQSGAARLQEDGVLGKQVPVLTPGGVEVALVTVGAIQDPFEAYDPAYPPVHGYHYVLIEVDVEVTGSLTVRIDPSQVLIRDTEGFLYGDATIYRPEGESAPDLEYQDVESGYSTAGAIGFQVLNDVTISDILLFPGDGLVVELVDFGTASAPEIGEEVPWIGYEGEEIGAVASLELIDPFDEYDANYPPDRGYRYVMLSVVILNTGPRSIHTDPAGFFLQDADGFLYGDVTIYQPDETERPELEYGDLAPGKDTGGSIGFLVPAGMEIARVLFQPSGDRLLTIVDLSPGGTTSDGPSTDPTARPDVAVAGVDCDEVEEWLTIAYSEASAVTSIVGMLMVMRTDGDPGYAELAHQVASAFASTAAGLTDFDVPFAVEELNQQLADAFEAYGKATEDLATAVEQEDDAAIDAAGQAVYDAEPALIFAIDAVTALAEDCDLAG